MIISSDNFFLTYDELEELFNKALMQETDNWYKEKQDFLADPFNASNSPIGSYMPNTCFQVWLKIDKNVVSRENEDKLKNNIIEAGWQVHTFKWQEDERTGSEQLYICIVKPKDCRN